MIDELQQLSQTPELMQLLNHYVERAAADRQAWQDRLMELDGCSARELSRCHGKLIAYGWLEQNTGDVGPGTAARDGVPACYRATRSGVRALEQAMTGSLEG